MGARCAGRARRARLHDPRVGYACGRVRFVQGSARPLTGQQGPPVDGAGTPPTRRASTGATRWRCARASRACRSITAGNGAIYATRRDSYIVVDPIMGHDLSFPFNMVKRGWRAVDVPSARATEKMVPSIEGEWRRKRRMMSHTWPIVVRGGMLSPRGYTPGYALMILSHRLLRYLTPFLHALAFAANVALVAGGRGHALHGHARPAARAARRRRCSRGRFRVRPLLIARYYVLTTPPPPPACGTGCVTAPPPPGKRPRAPDDPACDRRRGRARSR